MHHADVQEMQFWNTETLGPGSLEDMLSWLPGYLRSTLPWAGEAFSLPTQPILATRCPSALPI